MDPGKDTITEEGADTEEKQNEEVQKSKIVIEDDDYLPPSEYSSLCYIQTILYFGRCIRETCSDAETKGESTSALV